MATFKPFAALLPRAREADRICALPYDVMSSAEAREMARDNPLSFLHVSKPEIDLPEDTDPHADIVYAKGRENFERLIAEGTLYQDTQPAYYLYRQVMGNHSQIGLVGVASCEDYDQGIIKKHELTRPDKETDRVRHIEALNAQTGPVFLTYHAVPELDARFDQLSAAPPQVDFPAPDGVRHTAWHIHDAETIRSIEQRLAQVDRFYIADGHHRSAAASRVAAARKGAGNSGYFLTVLFSHRQMQILPYNRALRDLNGMTADELRAKLETVFDISKTPFATPKRKHDVGLFLEGKWIGLTFKPALVDDTNPLESLDVNLLQTRVLEPFFSIDNPRTSERISFVGGIRGTAELEKLVNSQQHACAFSMFATRIEDLMAISDQDGLMPPKSTWFEPKLRDAMFCHRI